MFNDALVVSSCLRRNILRFAQKIAHIIDVVDM